MPRNPRPHIPLPEQLKAASPFRATNPFGRDAPIPQRNRATQSAHFRAGIRAVADSLPGAVERQREAGWDSGFGVQVVFSSFPDVSLAVESLDLKSVGIELLSVRQVDSEVQAVIWFPPSGVEHFERKVADYVAERRSRSGRALDNQKLIDAVRTIRTAVMGDLWVDEAPMPQRDEVCVFEAWISAPHGDLAPGRVRQRGPIVTDIRTREERFRRSAAAAGLVIGRNAIRFAERLVLQVRGSLAQFEAAGSLLGYLAELRFAPESADFFMGLDPVEQIDWAEELISRSDFELRAESPAVCILDTGCSSGHPLLAAALDASDLHTVNVAWGLADQVGHGTGQAGIALWGDLTDPVSSADRILLRHRLESVKLLPHNGANRHEHLGALTIQAVSLPEIKAPEVPRVFSMAVTSDRSRMSGRPTSWSAVIDSLASDWAGEGDARRLFVISGGNVPEVSQHLYFASNTQASIEDPSNCWNALVVGAITRKVTITERGAENYHPVASAGELSPYSSTSASWLRDAPFRPDVVFEGGNVGDDGTICSRFDSLSLLTTNHQPLVRHFATTWATSAATALASRFAARIMVAYPTFWPETVRAIIVHSANWTDALVRQFPGGTRDFIEERIRHCGWGEPEIDDALASGSDALTLVGQDELRPYARAEAGHITAGEMNLHRIPWPTSILRDFAGLDVELRVTLSYFIEPNPGERGWSDRFRYASHGLRFAVQRPTETDAQFMRRINRLAEGLEDDVDVATAADPRWLLGARRRFRGSLHHDRIVMPAVELASRQHVAVYPVSGWWKTRQAQNRYERAARYALLVSIKMPGLPNDIDLYAAVQNEIATEVGVQATVPI